MNRNSTLEPELIERARGGWLAVTRREAPIRIGAAGRTEDEAREGFARLVAQWEKSREEEKSENLEVSAS